jgi:hypothetical protein
VRKVFFVQSVWELTRLGSADNGQWMMDDMAPQYLNFYFTWKKKAEYTAGTFLQKNSLIALIFTFK